jgi:cell division protein FtsW
LNPELDLKGKGHQPYQAKIAAGSGQLLGRGPGNSLQKLSYLPEAQNDYIAAIYAEEFGFLGIVTLIVLYMIIAYVGFYIAHICQDRNGLYFATAITFLICFQAFMNLGVVSGLLPSTGLNLPFFSQGGTSLMANIAGLGLLLNIAYQRNRVCLNEL